MSDVKKVTRDAECILSLANFHKELSVKYFGKGFEGLSKGSLLSSQILSRRGKEMFKQLEKNYRKKQHLNKVDKYAGCWGYLKYKFEKMKYRKLGVKSEVAEKRKERVNALEETVFIDDDDDDDSDNESDELYKCEMIRNAPVA